MDPFVQASVEGAAARHKLDAPLLLAQVLVESGGNPYAWNPEPRYRYFWDVKQHKPFRAVTPLEVASKVPPVDFPFLRGDRDQEWWAQQASWGLLQVMGAVAREHGFSEPYLPALTIPDVGLQYGCLVLVSLLKWSGGNTEQTLAAYNGGRAGNEHPPYRNAAYAAKVLSARATLVAPGPSR